MASVGTMQRIGWDVPCTPELDALQTVSTAAVKPFICSEHELLWPIVALATQVRCSADAVHGHGCHGAVTESGAAGACVEGCSIHCDAVPKRRQAEVIPAATPFRPPTI